VRKNGGTYVSGLVPGALFVGVPCKISLRASTFIQSFTIVFQNVSGLK